MTNIEEQRAYWTRQLAGLPPPPLIPLSSERPPVSSFLRQTVEVRVEPEIWTWAKELTVKLGGPPQAALMSAFHALFFRYSGQADFGLGTLVARADEAGQGELVALRVRVEPEDTADVAIGFPIRMVSKS